MRNSTKISHSEELLTGRVSKWARRIVLAAAFAGPAALATVIAPTEARADAADPRLDAARAKAAADYPTCTKTPSDADVKGAKGSHEAAKQYLDRGSYDKAIQAWNEAYGFDCSRPSVFQNLSTAYERKGDRAMTIAILELVVARDPSADRSTIEAKIDNLKKLLAAEPPPAPDKPKETAPVKPEAPATTHMERPFGPAPWITLGIGGAALVAGIPLLIIGRHKVSDADKLCPTHDHCPANAESEGNQGITFTGAGAGLIGGGGAVVIGSLIWQLVGNKERAVPDKTSLRFTPSVAPGWAGGSLTGRF